jgi:hypothetical protein
MDATAGVAFAAATGMHPMQLGMRANNEGDYLTRRHLDLGGTLTVTYNTVPNVPSSLSMVSPPRACGTAVNPVYVNGGQPITLQALVTDPDGGNVNARFDVVDAATLTRNAIAPLGTPNQAQGMMRVQIPAGSLPGSPTRAYAWRVTAGDLVDLSGPSGWCYFTVKNTPPGLPTISTVTPASVVGAPMTVRFASPAADKVAGFAYWWTNATSATPTVAAPALVTTGSGFPSCGTITRTVTYVCADAAGKSPVVTVAPVDDTSTLWVASYAAECVNGQVQHRSTTGLTVVADPTTGTELYGWSRLDYGGSHFAVWCDDSD